MVRSGEGVLCVSDKGKREMAKMGGEGRKKMASKNEGWDRQTKVGSRQCRTSLKTVETYLRRPFSSIGGRHAQKERGLHQLNDYLNLICLSQGWGLIV